MKTKIAMVVLLALVVLGFGHRASAQGRGSLFCVTPAGTEPMVRYAPPGSSCFIIVDPYTGYRVWGIVEFLFY